MKYMRFHFCNGVIKWLVSLEGCRREPDRTVSRPPKLPPDNLLGLTKLNYPHFQSFFFSFYSWECPSCAFPLFFKFARSYWQQPGSLLYASSDALCISVSYPAFAIAM